MLDYDPKDYLLFGLKHFDISVIKVEGKIIELEKGYTIEIEGKELFKLIHTGQVVAPFSDVEELCEFIKKDIEVNE